MAARRVLAAIALAMLPALSLAQSLDGERRALDQARAQARTAEARAAMLEKRAAAEQGRVEKALARSAAVASRVQAAEAAITAAETRVRLIEGLRARQAARLAEKQAPAARLLAALQIMARRPPVLALIQPGSAQDMVHSRALLGAMLPVIRERTAGLRADIETSRQLRGQARQALAALRDGRRVLDRERLVLVRLAAERRRASQGFASNAVAEQDRAMAMGERARDITDLISQLQVDAVQSDRLAALPGPLLRPAAPAAASALPVDRRAADAGRLPYRLPVAGRIVSGLGEVSRGGVRSRGVSIATRPAAQVVAPAAGRIAFAAPYRGFGRIAIIDHGGGWTTLLTGLATLDVAAGDAVLQGGPIGRSPDREPQITVELRRGERPVDITRLVS